MISAAGSGHFGLAIIHMRQVHKVSIPLQIVRPSSVIIWGILLYRGLLSAEFRNLTNFDLVLATCNSRMNLRNRAFKPQILNPKP
jgi:hypothetical protein